MAGKPPIINEDSLLIPLPTPSSLSPQSLPSQTERDISIRYANDIAYGLVVTSQRGQIRYGTPLYRKVQDTIRWLRRGKSVEASARLSKVPISIVEQLVEFGQSRSLGEIQSPPPETERDISIRYANDIAYGLAIASQKRQIHYGTRMYRKVQDTIYLLRRGKDLGEAARLSKVPMSVIEQLLKWGQNRPGSNRANASN